MSYGGPAPAAWQRSAEELTKMASASTLAARQLQQATEMYDALAQQLASVRAESAAKVEAEARLRQEASAALRNAEVTIAQLNAEKAGLIDQLAAEKAAADAARAQAGALLEAEREKRIAQLQALAGRRIAQLGLSRGWRRWQAQNDERLRLIRLAKRASSRLANPRLSASFDHWFELSSLESAEERRARKRREAEEALQRERDQRLAHLGMVAGKRIKQLNLARGWRKWCDENEMRMKKNRLLRHAAYRLVKPKLVASWVHWHDDYEYALRHGINTKLKELEEYIRTHYQPLIAKLQEELQAEMLKARKQKAEWDQLSRVALAQVYELKQKIAAYESAEAKEMMLAEQLVNSHNQLASVVEHYRMSPRAGTPAAETYRSRYRLSTGEQAPRPQTSDGGGSGGVTLPPLASLESAPWLGSSGQMLPTAGHQSPRMTPVYEPHPPLEPRQQPGHPNWMSFPKTYDRLLQE